MTGYIRFVLAIAVLFSHLGVTINGLNPGVVAVIMFYMLAGSVVAHVWQDILPEGKNKYMGFCMDRALRIFPLYIYTMVLTLLFVAVTGYGNPHYPISALVNNLLVVPLNYYMFLDSTILTEPSWWLIPQAWSLGAELQVYLLLPVIFINKQVRYIFFIASFTVYMLANLGCINTDYYGYRLVPGVLFIFIMGVIIKESQVVRYRAAKHWVLYIGLVIIYVMFEFYDVFKVVYAQETMIGLLIGVPLLTYAGRTKIKLPYNAMMGSMSYGVFLTHFLVIWVLDYSQIIQKATIMYFVAILLMTLIIAFIGVVLVETKIALIRTRVRVVGRCQEKNVET